ncbi:MAG: hypothetical protein ABI142_01675, partial [Bryocella sp.]
ASSRAFAQSNTATLTLHPEKPGPTIPHNFIGLSYETQQLSDPTFFSQHNTGLIAQIKALAPHGVLRLGGNTSDYGFWKPTPTSKMPERKPRAYKVGDPPPNMSYAVTPEAVRNLNAFLEATGWTCLYGINFGNNTPSLAAEEATFVTKILGTKLEYLQIGNEADRFGKTIRDPKLTGKPWNADTFLDEWLTFAKAILAKVPTAKFGMPDIASNAAWFATIGTRLADDPIREHIACLTHHYYIGGPPSNPAMTIEHILKPDPRVEKIAQTVQSAAEKLHKPYRMTEGNTCYRGGKPGVSDVFASALWSADYLLLLASLGYAGVNLHGGDGPMVANSLGGKLPGDEIVLAEHGDPASHPHPYYTPIAHIGNDYIAEPVSYGMKFAGMFAGATMISVDFNPGAINATAYAAKLPNGDQILAIINKDSLPLEASVGKHNSAMFQKLEAPSLTSREAHFGDFHEGAKCSPKGICTSYGSKIGTMTADAWLHLTVPAASAIFVELDKEQKGIA